MKSLKCWIPMVVSVVLLAGVLLYGPMLVGQVTYAVAESQNKADRANLVELSKHDQLSALFRAVAKTVRPAVVEVRVTKRVKIWQMPGPDIEEFFRRHFGQDVPFKFKQPGGQSNGGRAREFVRRGLGSGVIIDAEKGYVLTNHHVVGDADEVEVVLADKRVLKTDWIRSDPQTDLAVVKVKPDRLIDAPLGDSDRMEVGDWVLAIGAPEGLPQTVTAGIISAKGRTTNHPRMYQNFLQTDAAINRGNSGGPLVNMRGEVIGINTAIVSRTGINEGIGLAIPSNMAKRIMLQLIETGKVVRGYLGVRIQNVDAKLAESFKLPNTKGALIAQVAPGSPAQKAGLKEGDFVVRIDGKAVRNVNELRNRVAALKPGQECPFEVYRGGKKITVKVTIIAQPANMALAFRGMPREYSDRGFGLKVVTLTDELAGKFGYDKGTAGVIVIEVDKDSDAAEKGIKPGTVITHIQGKAVKSAAQFAAALKAGSPKGVRLRVMDPDGNARFVFLAPAKPSKLAKPTK